MARDGLEELFERFRRDGDLDALAEIFDRTAEKLLKVARHLCQDEAQAEDVVQATLLTAIESRAAFDAKRDLVPWLMGILTRKAKVARTLSSRLIALDRLAEQAVDDPVSDAELQELRSTVERAIERVPDTYREALLLHLRDGKDADEIARELGRPAGTIRVQLHRGLKYLRRGLPASIAFAGIAIGPRGLAAMRAEVLGSAGSVVAATTGGSIASATVGGMIMGKKIVVGLGVAAIAAGVAWLGARRSPELKTENRAAATEAVALSTPVEKLAPTTSPLSERVQATALPDASPAPRDPYGSLDMEWTWADLTPAAGIGVGAVSKSEPQYYDHPFFGTTDEHGRITFDHLREGKILIYTSRDGTGPERESTVTAGRCTSERFSIPNAEDVYGLVVDAAGLPVADADIRISPSYDDGGSVEAKSTQAGSYFVRAVPKRMSLFATAEGRGSSKLVSLRELDPEGKGEIELQIVLKGECSTVRGTVLDPEGKGVSGAWVTLHPRWDRQERSSWPAVWTPTGSDGSFHLGGMHAGAADIEVVAVGFASWMAALNLEADQTLDLVARLEPGFTIRGVARTTEGTPLEHVQVEQGPAGGSEDFRSWRHGRVAWSNADGAYDLAHVPAGEVDLRAELRGEGSMMRDSTHRSGRSEEVVTWDPVMKEGMKIHGRIVDDAGKPLAGWTIGGMPEPGKTGQGVPNAKSDARGEFVLADCAEGTYTLHAYPPGTSVGQIARVTERGVPAGGNVVLTAPHGWDSEAWISGKVVDENGSPIHEGNVSAQNRESRFSSSVHTFAADGGFKVGPLPPGHYDVHVYPKDLPGIDVPVPEELAASEVRDVGTIRTRARGRCELRLTMSDGSPVDTPFIVLQEGTLGHPLEGKDGVLFRSEELYEGTYTLVVNGVRITTIETNIEIRAGETTSCSLSAKSGTLQDIRFTIPETELVPELLTVVVRKADGAKLLEEQASLSMTKDRRIFRSFHGGFEPGHYTFEAASPEGWTAQGAFEIEDSVVKTSAIEVPLRRK